MPPKSRRTKDLHGGDDGDDDDDDDDDDVDQELYINMVVSFPSE